jgi:Domain of unknown function (DUF4920)
MRFSRLVATLALIPALALAAETAKTFGKPLTGLQPMALAEVLSKPEQGRAVCLEGNVAAVCAEKGCWLELRQGEQSVHVTFQGYSFFVPKDSKGKAVKLEGKLQVRQPKADEVEHLEGEGAGAAAASAVSVVASGVELK